MFNYSGFVQLPKDSNVGIISNIMIEKIIPHLSNAIIESKSNLSKGEMHIEINTGKHPIIENESALFFSFSFIP